MPHISDVSEELRKMVSRKIQAIQNLPEMQQNEEYEQMKIHFLSDGRLDHAQDHASNAQLSSHSGLDRILAQKQGVMEQKKQANVPTKCQTEIGPNVMRNELEKADEANGNARNPIQNGRDPVLNANETISKVRKPCTLWARTANSDSGPSVLSDKVPARGNRSSSVGEERSGTKMMAHARSEGGTETANAATLQTVADVVMAEQTLSEDLTDVQNLRKMEEDQKTLDAAQEDHVAGAAAGCRMCPISIATRLKDLEHAEASIDRVKDVLAECIAVLIERKLQISNLASFLRALSAMSKALLDIKVDHVHMTASASTADTLKHSLLHLNNLGLTATDTPIWDSEAYLDLLQMVGQLDPRVHDQPTSLGLELVPDFDEVIKNNDKLGSELGVVSDLPKNA